MLHLRVREHLVNRVDRAARDAGGVEFFIQASFDFFGEFADLGVESLSVLRPIGTFVAYSGRLASSGAPSASQKRCQIRPPVVAILM